MKFIRLKEETPVQHYGEVSDLYRAVRSDYPCRDAHFTGTRTSGQKVRGQVDVEKKKHFVPNV